ncbi:MAG TPA: hypothetical protein VGL13_15680 [Polyangiaceae bacterium]
MRQPPGIPPSETSVTREEPGGNANDPHQSALRRLLAAGWGWRNDKQDALHVPLPDWQNWRRIRYFGVPSFVGFRYGDDHHAVIAIWVRDVDEGVTTPDACLESFEHWAEPTAHEFSVSIGEATVTRAPWPREATVADAGPGAGATDADADVSAPNVGSGVGSGGGGGGGGGGGEVVVKSLDAEVTALFSRKTYAAAYAAYVLWPRTCTIFGIAVPMLGNDDLARQVRDRYVNDGFVRMVRNHQDTPQH